MKKLFLFLFCRWENWGWYRYLLYTQRLLAGVWRFQCRYEIKLGKITICYPIFRRSVLIAAYRPSMVMNQEGKADIADFSCTLVLFVLDYGSLSNMNKSLTFFQCYCFDSTKPRLFLPSIYAPKLCLVFQELIIEYICQMRSLTIILYDSLCNDITRVSTVMEQDS